jgi:hypothetical protein
MSESRKAQIAALERAVLDGKGTLSPEERRVFAYEDELPSPWETWITQVRRLAEGCTDEMVADLRGAGQSEEAIYEATVSASLGAGLSRLRAAQRALGHEEQP